MKKTYKVGERVIVNITDTLKLPATIIRAQKNFCIVKYDDAGYCNNICQYSELTPITH